MPPAHRSIGFLPPRSRRAGNSRLNILIGLTLLATLAPFLNHILVMESIGDNTRVRQLEQQIKQQPQHPSLLTTKGASINSYWWPSAKDGGGVLGKIYAMQNPSDCAAPSTKYFVLRAKKNVETETRGLSAFAHAAGSHMLHALTDGEQFAKYGPRVMITNDDLFPMAKGCANGPETRDCYFEPLTLCKMSDVDAADSPNALTLKDVNEEYDRTTRTVYSSDQIWFRITNKKYSWTKLPGGDKDHSHQTMVAALFAYYFRPVDWLREEINQRLMRSIPSDLNPDRTIGVPIRRSDKCRGHNVEGSAGGEMECPPLEAYLHGVKVFIEFDPLIENIILTSEDKAACDEFLELLKKELPALRVVLNVGDVQQGTGSGSKLESYVAGAANANVIASALTSMHMHMRARYFVITTMSTWTSTIATMAREYGFASNVYTFDIGP
eukprot:CAMPEP_0183715984 /NCGR_PEP_ID=MMETSP0737-20130205/10028_1 /TAXON_ID=385413 /ORGANISM="Thalassiosira miniscula, Strain CCMP1093" /LENGTH=438 /DNA_ID=CAMNT_0025945177 /DNA_START=108 /DNA_END=1421 /DNA_ORIENTATION=+